MRIVRALLFILGCAGAAFAQDSKPATDVSRVVGIWEGTIEAGGQKLRVAVKVTKTDDRLTGTFDSIDQGAKDLKIDDVKLVDAVFSFKLRVAFASYKGVLAADGRSIDGTWKQGGELPLVLRKVEKASELSRPQNPQKPYPYREVEVSYAGGPGVTLAGTLTLPAGEGPFPVALLITGSGQQDRDETLLGHKPFLVIADHLTRAGVAVLRVDDRGVGGSTGEVANATSADFADDVRAGVKFLRGRKEIDATKIGLIGHSEGGIIAPMVAATDPAIAFCVLLAGPGVDGGEILHVQGRRIAEASGASAEAVQKSVELNDGLFAIMRREKDLAKMVALARKYLEDAVDREGEGITQGLGKAKFVDTSLAQAGTAWFHFFVGHDPRPVLAKVKCPLLALNGALDLQVDVEQNLPVIEKTLKDAGAKDVTTKAFPGLNHLFQHAKTGSPTEYATIEETISPEVLECLKAWITARVLPKK